MDQKLNKINILESQDIISDIKNIKKNSVIIISSATCQESIYNDIKYYKILVIK